MLSKEHPITCNTPFTPIGIPAADSISNGNVLRNVNSYEYLGYIAMNIPFELEDLTPAFKEMCRLYHQQPIYQPEYPYGNLYTQFLLDFEKYIFSITNQLEIYEAEKNSNNNASALNIAKNNRIMLDTMIDLIFANPNKGLERSYLMIKKCLEGTSQTSKEVESVVTKRLNKTTGGPPNNITPQEAGSALGRLKATLSSDFKPNTTTSMPSLRIYQHQKFGQAPIECRFGTQGQYRNGSAEVCPLFKAWLYLQQRKHPQKKITHIYFNNLAYTRKNSHEERRERNLSLQLHALPHNNIALITLPADMYLLKTAALTIYNRENCCDYESAKSIMLQIAIGVEDKPIEDFYIHHHIKTQLYGEGDPYNKATERKILSHLIDKSFDIMGVKSPHLISKPLLQAIFFHFIKYELTNFIIEKLQPESFNISCKDAIDRAGVASAYYNLMKSFEKNIPMSLDEFTQALHGAPTLVKGRGMNSHIKLIWNAIDTYINAYDKTAKESGHLPPQCLISWLRSWRDQNVLKYSKSWFIHELTQYIQQRSQEPNYFSIFGEIAGMDSLIKITLAKKLLASLEGNKQVEFEVNELEVIKNGRLGKIYYDMLAHSLILKPNISSFIDYT